MEWGDRNRLDTYVDDKKEKEKEKKKWKLMDENELKERKNNIKNKKSKLKNATTIFSQ